MTKIKILQETIYSLYDKKLVRKWAGNVDKALLFVRYASSKDDQKSLLKNDVQLRKSLSNLEYPECVLSAFLFCIECKKHNTAELKIFISNSMYNFAPLFLAKDARCPNSFLFIIRELNLVNLFPLQVVFGFVQYLTLSKVKEKTTFKTTYPYENNNISSLIHYLDRIDRFLHLFSFFSTPFIQQCKKDCMSLGNLAPVSLALQVLYVKSISHQNYTILVYDKNHTLLEFNKNLACKELETFKNQLIHLKLVNTGFILKCNFSWFYDKQKQRIPFRQYYSSFDGSSISENLLENVKFSYVNIVPLLIAIGGISIGWTAAGLPSPPRMTLNRQEPAMAASPASATSLTTTRLTTPMRPNRDRHVLSAGTKASMPTLWGFEDQSGTVKFAKVDIVQLGEGRVKYRNKTYVYQRVMVNGELCFSTLGISGIYSDMPEIQKALRDKISKKWPDYRDIMEVIGDLTDNKNITISFDHTAIEPIRQIFNIRKNQAFTFAVPGTTINGLRTNNREGLLPCSEYDLRPDFLFVTIGKDSPFNGSYTFRKLYQEGLQMNFDMWLKRVQTEQPDMFPFVQAFRTPMYNGFLVCVDQDLVYMNNFFLGFDSSVDNPESVLIYQNEALNESIQQDIRNLRIRLYTQYEKTETKIITKPRTIEVFLESAAFKHKLGRSFENLSKNKKFLQHAKAQRIRLVNDTRRVVNGCLTVYRNTKGFDSEIARIETALANFDQEIGMSDLFSAEQCQYLINTHIKLGYFYGKTEFNGNICDYTIAAAKRDAQLRNEDVSLYIQDNKHFLHPV